MKIFFDPSLTNVTHQKIVNVRMTSDEAAVFQGGPGHLYLLKNKVATFAKVEKEEDMSQ